jgi:hypothetical protein
MSRKRKSDQEPTAEIPTAVVAPPVAEPTTGVAELPPAEANADGQSFADKVGQKKWVAPADPSGIAKDNLAGVQLFESKQDRQVAIKFGDGSPEQKPGQAVIGRMKEAGYRWNPADRIWAHPVRPESAMSTRIEAEQLYQEVRQMIREEKGIGAEHEQGVPF